VTFNESIESLFGVFLIQIGEFEFRYPERSIQELFKCYLLYNIGVCIALFGEDY
jgi:hypothetical protein